MRVHIDGWLQRACLAVLVLLAGCGGGGGGGADPVDDDGVIYVEFGYEATAASVRQAVTISPHITGLDGRQPVCSLAGGDLPPGMVISTDCTIGGTPIAAGDYAVVVRLTTPGVEGFIDGSASIAIDDPTPSLAAKQGNDPAQTVRWRAFVGSAWLGGAVVELSNYTARAGDLLTYAVTSGAPPHGLAFDPATGALSGVTSTYGSFSFTVVATLRRNGIDYATEPAVPVVINVVEDAVLLEYAACDAIWAMPVSCAATFNTQPIAGAAVQFGAAALPPGFSLNPATGTFSGTPATLLSELVPITAAWTLPDGRVVDLATQINLHTTGVSPIYGQSPGVTGVVSGPLPDGGLGAVTAGLASGQAFWIPPTAIVISQSGDAYLFQLVQRDANFVVPSWISIDPATGVLSGTPPSGAVGVTHYWSVRMTTQRNGLTLVVQRDWSATVQ
jgi:hypothetical protein